MTWFQKAEAETDPNYGTLPQKRPLNQLIENGIVNLDKPSGPTSRQVSDWVKTILKTQKAGHSGTLDPKVTGVFVVALNNATKLIPTLILSPKEYVCYMRLHGDVSLTRLKAVFREFTGTLYQKPPIRSSVLRRLRKRTIYKLTILEKDGQDVLFHVRCEAGTYIRKLCHDIGAVLACNAHMAELRRVKTSGFDESTLVTLQQLSEAQYLYQTKNDDSLLRKCIQPAEVAANCIPKIVVQDSAIESLCNGAPLHVPGAAKFEPFKKGQTVALLSLKGELIALAQSECDSEWLKKANKGKAAKIQRVIMPAGTYPRWKKE